MLSKNYAQLFRKSYILDNLVSVLSSNNTEVFNKQLLKEPCHPEQKGDSTTKTNWVERLNSL